ncbi:hypothetical protein FRB91_002350 [Serendipita sp. 411]|nr:hypothetical protein FRB91_002350 [Serendipita sp. 411]
MDNSLTMQPPYDIDSNNNNNDSLLSLRTSPIDLKGKGREQEQPKSASSTLFESLGWTEYILPDTSYYFALHVSSPASPQHLRMPSPIFISPPPPQPPTVTVVADYDLRNQQILKRVCEEMRTLIKMELPAGSSSDRASGWELWLHRPLGYIPSHLDTTRPPIVHTWVNHTRRLLAPRPLGTVELPPREDGDVVTLVNGYGKSSTTSVGVAGPSNGPVVETDRERLSKELAYWAFVERHPAHGILNETARREALEGLTWTFADRLAQSNTVLPSPFSQDECQSILRLLDRQSALSVDQDRMVVNRMIASVHNRMITYRIASLDASHSLEMIKKDGQDKISGVSRVVFPFRRAILGFLSAVVCWAFGWKRSNAPSRAGDLFL